jgi:hypothetical protein
MRRRISPTRSRLESAHIDMLIFVIAIRRFEQFAKSSAQLGFPELHRQRKIRDRGAAVGCRLDAAARALHPRGANVDAESASNNEGIVALSGQVTPICDRNWKLAASRCKIGSDRGLLQR